MKLLPGFILAFTTIPLLASPAAAQAPAPSSLTEKLNAYVGCINRLSERSYDSRKRYFSWVSKNGPTGTQVDWPTRRESLRILTTRE